MPCSSALSWSSFPLRATDLAITCTSAIVVQPPKWLLEIPYNLPLLQSGINQRQICCRIKPLPHRCWLDCDHYLQRRRYIRIKKMAALGCSVWTPHHQVRMDCRLTLIERDVTAHSNDFVLTFNANLLVHFALRIEPPQGRSVHRSIAVKCALVTWYFSANSSNPEKASSPS